VSAGYRGKDTDKATGDCENLQKGGVRGDAEKSGNITICAAEKKEKRKRRTG